MLSRPAGSEAPLAPEEHVDLGPELPLAKKQIQVDGPSGCCSR